MKTALRVPLAVLAVALCGLAQTGAPAASASAQTARDEFVRAYKIGPDDLLSITVFEVPELNIKVRVSQDGSISLPLLKRVEVGGLTQEGVVQKLTQLLQGGFVKNPQVTVFIEEYKSQQVAVIGAVQNPASYPLVGRKSLLQVLSMAGGITDRAGSEAFIIREGPDGNGGPTTIAIDLDALGAGNQELNVPIEPNDVINVPIDKEIRVFVMGQVTRPGPLTAKQSVGLTLFQAIAGAGGLAPGAKESAIMVSRKNKTGQETKFKVNLKDIIKGKKMDFRLQDGDVVYVPESFW